MSYQAPPNGWRTFVTVWATQSVSVFGTALTFFAITIWLTQVLYPRPEQKPELAFALALLGLAGGLPIVFVGPIAGAWADRHDRKRTMIIMDVGNGFLSLILLALIVTHTLQLWLLLPIVLVLEVLGMFHGSAFDTSYSMLVREEQLPRANGMMQTIWSLSGILSPLIAANIIVLPALARSGVLPGTLNDFFASMTDGTPILISIDAVTYFIAAAVLVFLYIPSPKRTDLGEGGKLEKSLMADVKEGALYIWHRRTLIWLLGTFAVANFTGTAADIMMPLLVKFNLAADWQSNHMEFAQALSWLASAGGVGGLVGGLFISAWGGLKSKRVYGVIVPMIFSGIAQVVFGLSPILILSTVMIFFFTAMTPILNAHSQAIWQTQTPRELQGRVFSVRRVIAQFTVPLSTVMAGIFGGAFDPGIVVAVMGAIFTIFCVAQLFNPYLLKVEDKAALDQQAAQHESPQPAAQPDGMKVHEGDVVLPMTGEVQEEKVYGGAYGEVKDEK